MDKNSYALGMSIAHNMLQSGVKEVAFEDFVAGLKATLTRQEPVISYQEAGDILDKYFQQLQENGIQNPETQSKSTANHDNYHSVVLQFLLGRPYNHLHFGTNALPEAGLLCGYILICHNSSPKS